MIPEKKVPPPPFLGRGLAFPPVLDPRWGALEMVEGETDVQQSIRIIVGTARGERVMRPDFGCGIHELPFEAISSQLVAEIRKVVREALVKFEARIDVMRVDVDTQQSTKGFLDIDVQYRVRTTNQPGNLVFPFYIPEGS
jgi:phage baseplate assembly protein W